jgi:hypothetical protein
VNPPRASSQPKGSTPMSLLSQRRSRGSPTRRSIPGGGTNADRRTQSIPVEPAEERAEAQRAVKTAEERVLARNLNTTRLENSEMVLEDVRGVGKKDARRVERREKRPLTHEEAVSRRSVCHNEEREQAPGAPPPDGDP